MKVKKVFLIKLVATIRKRFELTDIEKNADLPKLKREVHNVH